MVGLDMPALEILPTLLAAPVVWPLATPDSSDSARLAPAGALFAVSGVIAAVLHLTSPWTARHPNAAEPIFVIDPAGHQAWRTSLQPMDSWTRGLVTAEGGAIKPETFAFWADPLGAAPAAYQPIDPPSVQAVAGQNGTVTITATPHAGSARIIVRFRAPNPISDVYIDGQRAVDQPRGATASAVNVARGQWGAVLWTAPDSMTMTLHTSDPARLEVNATEIYDRWISAKPLPPTPPREQMWSQAGSTYVVGKVRVQP